MLRLRHRIEKTPLADLTTMMAPVHQVVVPEVALVPEKLDGF